jgi:hypothetical protein
LKEKVAAPVQKAENTAMGIRHADRVALTSLTSGGRSVSIVCSWTQATEFSFSFIVKCHGMNVAIFAELPNFILCILRQVKTLHWPSQTTVYTSVSQ